MSSFYDELDRRCAIGPGVRKILSTPLHYDDSNLEPVDPTRAEAERPKVELPPYDERCKEEIAVASRKEMGAIYTILHYKAALDSRERQLHAALTEIAELKARLQK